MSIISKEVFTFIEVARWRSVRKAAERLNISASALSRQLRILEADLGIQLVSRHANGVQVTEAGEQFLAHARQMIALESTLRGDISAAAGSRRLHIRLGVVESISAELALRLRAHLGKSDENVRLDVLVDGTDRLVARLAEGHLDAVVAFNMTTDERFRTVTALELPVGLVCARELLPDPPASIALADCLTWPLCLPGEDLSILPRLMSEIYRQERAFRVAASSNSFATLCGLIADGAGVGFMTLLDVVAQPVAEKLRFVPLRDRRLTENVSFAVASHIRLRSEIGAALMPIGKIVSDITKGLSGKSNDSGTGD